MILWRISNHISLSGLGAELSGGRWHTAAPGKRVAYLAEHAALSLIENLVNLRRDGSLYPATFQLLKVAVPNGVYASGLTPEQISRVDPNNVRNTQAMGDAWLAARSSALLRVASIPAPESWNYLLNPSHPDASNLAIEWAKRIEYDQRLFRLAN